MRLWLQIVLSLVIVLAGLVLAARISVPARAYLDGAGLAGPLVRIGLLPPPAGPSQDGSAAAGGGGSPVAVVASPPEMRVQQDTVSGIGTLRGKQSVVVTAGAAGRIVALDVASGDLVRAGDPIVELDAEAEKLAVEKARLGLRDAQANFDRLSQLRTAGSASPLQVQEGQLALDTAGLALQTAEYDLSQRRITAPIAGQVGVVDLGVGDRLAVGAQIVRIEDRASLIVDFRVPERFSGRLQRGMIASAAPLSSPDATFGAVISALDNRVDDVSRSLRVQATIERPDDSLRAGMALRISLVLKGDDLPAVSPLSVQWNAHGPYVWLVRAGKAVQLPVRIAQRESDAVLVDAQLLPGDLVVSEGVQSLRQGMAVSVAEIGDAAPKS